MADVKPAFVYCARCMDFCPSILFSTPGKNVCDKHSTLELDKSGRYCKMCDEFICISRFPKGQRRFVCKKHLWEFNGKRSKAKLRANPWNKELARLYSLCYSDRISFYQSKVDITQAGIGKLFVDMNFNEDSPQEKFGFAVLPINPYEILSSNNAVVVRREDRIKLISCLKEHDCESYTTMMRQMKSVRPTPDNG
jgi:hypothetical protein